MVNPAVQVHHGSQHSQRQSSAVSRTAWSLSSGRACSSRVTGNASAVHGLESCMAPHAYPETWKPSASYSTLPQQRVIMPLAGVLSLKSAAVRHRHICPAAWQSTNQQPACISVNSPQQKHWPHPSVAAAGSCIHPCAKASHLVDDQAWTCPPGSRRTIIVSQAVHGCQNHARGHSTLVLAAHPAVDQLAGSDDSYRLDAPPWRTKGIGQMTSEDKREVCQLLTDACLLLSPPNSCAFMFLAQVN